MVKYYFIFLCVFSFQFCIGTKGKEIISKRVEKENRDKIEKNHYQDLFDLLDQGNKGCFENGLTRLESIEKNEKQAILDKLLRDAVVRYDPSISLEFIKVLFKKGADPTHLVENELPICIASGLWFDEVIKYFISQQCNVRCVDGAGNIPLTYACIYKRYSIVKALMNYDPEFNCRGAQGISVIAKKDKTLQILLSGFNKNGLTLSDKITKKEKRPKLYKRVKELLSH